MLIIGYGNAERGDDAAGILVARRLRALGFNAIEYSGDGMSLIDLWDTDDDIVVVDAVITGSPPGSMHMWDPRSNQPVAASFCTSTHDFGLAEAIDVSRALKRLPRRITIYGIEAVDFTPGAPPTPEVLKAVERITDVISSPLQ